MNALLLLGGLAACNGGAVDPRRTADYAAIGFLIVDLDRDSTKGAVELRADNIIADQAEMSFGASSLLFFDTRFGLDSAYWLAQRGVSSFRNAAYPLTAIDSVFLNASTSQIVADSFSIIDIVPPSRIANGNENVSISWRGAGGAASYVVSTVLRSSNFSGAGLSQIVFSGTSQTVDRDAFFQSDGVNPDTGWYYITVYAIAGSPDSALTRLLLPTPLPIQRPDNLSGDLDGRFGSIVIARRDSVQIVIQP